MSAKSIATKALEQRKGIIRLAPSPTARPAAVIAPTPAAKVYHSS